MVGFGGMVDGCSLAHDEGRRLSTQKLVTDCSPGSSPLVQITVKFLVLPLEEKAKNRSE